MSGPDSSDRFAPSAQDLARWHAAVRRLPDAEREAFLLWRVNNLTQDQISERMGLPIKDVQILLGRALARLTRDLYPSDAGPHDAAGIRGDHPALRRRLRLFVSAGLQRWRRWLGD